MPPRAATLDRIEQHLTEHYLLHGIENGPTVRALLESGAMLALHEVERYLTAEGLHEQAAWLRAELDVLREDRR